MHDSKLQGGSPEHPFVGAREYIPFEGSQAAQANQSRLPAEGNDRTTRKATQLFMGVVKYFPDALECVARVSWVGNQVHNPGEPLHWAKEKSTDHLNSACRHISDYAKGEQIDAESNQYVLAHAAWRVLAQLQLDIEAGRTQ